MLSCGAKKCLDVLRWYAVRGWNPRQYKIASHLRVCDRQVRSYLSELKREGLITIKQSGDGRPASYVLTAVEKPVENMLKKSETSGLTSGLNFRAENFHREEKSTGNQEVEVKNFRPEAVSVLNLSSFSKNSREECTDQEATDRYTQMQLDTLRRHLRSAGFEHLADRVAAEARAQGVSLFAIAARIERAFRCATRKDSTKPHTDGWIWRVSGLARAASARPGMVRGDMPRPVVFLPVETAGGALAESPQAPRKPPDIAANPGRLSSQIALLARSKHMGGALHGSKGFVRASVVGPDGTAYLVEVEKRAAGGARSGYA